MNTTPASTTALPQAAAVPPAHDPADDVEILESCVEGSRLHWIINNPHDEGIDEG